MPMGTFVDQRAVLHRVKWRGLAKYPEFSQMPFIRTNRNSLMLITVRTDLFNFLIDRLHLVSWDT